MVISANQNLSFASFNFINQQRISICRTNVTRAVVISASICHNTMMMTFGKSSQTIGPTLRNGAFINIPYYHKVRYAKHVIKIGHSVTLGPASLAATSNKQRLSIQPSHRITCTTQTAVSSLVRLDFQLALVRLCMTDESNGMHSYGIIFNYFD